MAKKKELTPEAKRDYIEKIRNYSSWLETKTIPQQALYLTKLYEKSFKEGILRSSYQHGLKLIQSYLFISSELKPLKAQEIEKIFQNEFIFISKASSTPSLQPFILRILVQEFLTNLEHGNFYGFPKGESALHEDRIKDFKTEMIDIFGSSMNQDQRLDSLSSSIPETILSHVLNSPFYGPDLKLLFLKSEDPLNRKGLRKHLSVSYPEAAENIRLLNILKLYILAANELGISESIRATEKKLPVKDKRISKIISEITGEPNVEVVDGSLRKIFSLSKNAKNIKSTKVP